VEAQLTNLSTVAEGKPKGKRGRDYYVVERILEKKGWWYRVQWAGYTIRRGMHGGSRGSRARRSPRGRSTST
jgi:hypothetical protein